MTAKTRKWQALIAFLLLLLSLSCIIPLWLVASISFTDEAAIVKNGYSLIPSQFSTDAYATIFSGGKQVWRSYGISVFITIAGTIAHVAVTGMAGYSLANPSVRYRNGLAMFFFKRGNNIAESGQHLFCIASRRRSGTLYGEGRIFRNRIFLWL